MGAKPPPIWLAPNDRFPPNFVIRTLRLSAGNQGSDLPDGKEKYLDIPSNIMLLLTP